jgi:hypothetical protein
MLLGEIHVVDGVDEISQFDTDEPEEVEIWQCPSEIRAHAHEGLMKQALADLKACGASWSWATAVRAFLLQGDASEEAGTITLESLQKCWDAEPICTSVVITFWQRYLCQLARNSPRHGVRQSELDLILSYMPLKADRALPGELMRALRSHKWDNIARVPFAASPGSHSLFRIQSY